MKRNWIFGVSAVICAVTVQAQPAAAPAVSQQARSELSQALKAYKAGNADEALKRAMLAERSAGQDQVALVKALEIQGAAQLRKKDGAGAENAYLKLVIATDVQQKYYAIGAFTEFEAALKRDTDAGVHPSAKSLDVYLKLGRVSHKMTKNRELAVRCYRIIHAHGYQTGEAEDALGALGAMPADAVSARPAGKLAIHAIASFWVISDLLSAIRDETETIPLTFNSTAPCVGLGATYGLSSKLEISVDACGLFGSGDMTESDATLDYSPTGVTFIGGMIRPGLFWLPMRIPLAVGLEIPVLIRQIDAPELPVGSSTVVDLPIFDFGGALALRYRFGKFGVTAKGGYNPGYQTLLFGGQLSYQF